MIYDCIIIGAGAAGLFCGAAFPAPVRGLILEKTKQPGVKLLMSGSGQCNITHDGSIKDFVGCYGKNGGKIRSCLYKYSNLELIRFLNDRGVDTVTREDGKVFPASMDARQVRDMLLTACRDNGFTLRCEAPVTSLRRDGAAWQVRTRGGDFAAKVVIIAAGGCSYPGTGSDGAMLPVLERSLGIKTVPPVPALTPITVYDYPYGEIAGVSFRDMGVSLWRDGKKVAEEIGDVLFTHENLSGPAILNISKFCIKNDNIMLNYLYPWDKKMTEQTIRNMAGQRKMTMENLLSRELHLPKRFAKCAAAEAGGRLKSISAKLAEDTLTVSGTAGFDKAMVTAGGVDIAEINTAAMEFKNYPGLYAIGEVLDIDGRTGGYNLQFAYSSAKAAANAASRSIAEKHHL